MKFLYLLFGTLCYFLFVASTSYEAANFIGQPHAALPLFFYSIGLYAFMIMWRHVLFIFRTYRKGIKEDSAFKRLSNIESEIKRDSK